MTLTELDMDGQRRKVLLQAAKNGFFYVIDRTNGELLSANNFVPVTWASHIDIDTGRPVEIQENLYGVEEAKRVTPGPMGAHVWHSMSYSPETGLVYIPAQENVFSYTRSATYEREEMSWNLAINPDAELADGVANFVNKGYLLAWDPVTNTEAWRISHATDWNGGILSTAGNLIVQGSADGRLVIYRADNGEPLWEMAIRTGAVTGAISYAVDGEQYIAIAAGWAGAVPILGGGGGTPTHNAPMRILAFKLGGKATLPAPERKTAPALPEINVSEAVLAEGTLRYDMVCRTCHGFSVISGGMMPDLRYMSADTREQFDDIVLGGTRAEQGMASFANKISKEQNDAIYAYILTEAAKLHDYTQQAE
jgi:quinohemoprotein ethanol dehydrogenase